MWHTVYGTDPGRPVPELPQLTMRTDHLAELEQAVQRAIDDGSLGVPRFARFVAQAPLSGLAEIAANRLAAMSEAWFGKPCADRTTRRDPSCGSLTLLLKWTEGQGALIVVSSSPHTAGGSIDLMFIGSRGVLYHEA